MEDKRTVFIIGAKNIGMYGGYETFIDMLTLMHQDQDQFQYYVITKKNGHSKMDETKLNGVTVIDEDTFIYHNATVKKIHVPQIGPAQAIIYDFDALKYCISYAKENHLVKPIFYICSCRIGFMYKKLVKQIHEIGGTVCLNPDGHEWKRAKWAPPVRKYWKESEKRMVRYSDLMVCDSVNIEKYIQEEYKDYHPHTTFIAYGSDLTPSTLKDDDPAFLEWLEKHDVRPKEYYMCCGRLVPENSFEIMIREFMKTRTKKDFVLITTVYPKLQEELEKKLHYSKDKRIKFVGPVYNTQLLKKIRENAYANFHGHTVGGTNPSLLEALGSTDVNMLIDVPFNREVGLEAAVYWTDVEGNLARRIDEVDHFTKQQIEDYSQKAKGRIRDAYNWEYIASEYEKLWMSL